MLSLFKGLSSELSFKRMLVQSVNSPQIEGNVYYYSHT